MHRSPRLALLLCAPLILLIGGLVLYPFLTSLYLATLNKSETRFVGLGNYVFLFKRDTFWMVVRQSLLFTVTAVVLKTALGFFLALQINNLPAPRQRLWRGLFIIPWVMSISPRWRRSSLRTSCSRIGRTRGTMTAGRSNDRISQSVL